ncbi:alpha/beta fold hydrolase [Salipaludibacillus agaradhaerens]|uniref:alpha/beta fold hydrolase n=1 Tax=Salipaludibacillus agaradhaerens TaxID=76935 RepID=UPI00099651CE|nr:alpha/beta hydrolase [Salipaludibacillus agaradhaerens]
MTKKTVLSKDGTAIVYDQVGAGPVVILVNGALGYRSHPKQVELVSLLADQFTVINYDRRGRGESSDTVPYTVMKEIEDIEALINNEGGSASLFGMSSGAVLALEAANKLSGKLTKLAVFEPPLILDESRPPLPSHYVEQLNDAIQQGDRTKAVTIFMSQALLIPNQYLEPMQRDPMWQEFEDVAHTLPYDGMIVKDVAKGMPLPKGKWSNVLCATCVIAGEHSEAFFHDGAKKLVEHLNDGEYHILQGQDHDVAPTALAPLLKKFYTENRP